MTLFLLLMAAIMVCVGGALLAIGIILKIIQGGLWIFIKVLERFVTKSSLVESPTIAPVHPGDCIVVDLYPEEWRVMK